MLAGWVCFWLCKWFLFDYNIWEVVIQFSSLFSAITLGWAIVVLVFHVVSSWLSGLIRWSDDLIVLYIASFSAEIFLYLYSHHTAQDMARSLTCSRIVYADIGTRPPPSSETTLRGSVSIWTCDATANKYAKRETWKHTGCSSVCESSSVVSRIGKDPLRKVQGQGIPSHKRQCCSGTWVRVCVTCSNTNCRGPFMVSWCRANVVHVRSLPLICPWRSPGANLISSTSLIWIILECLFI